jgi:hypothetical protein
LSACLALCAGFISFAMISNKVLAKKTRPSVR